jgi:hypothetical protein
MNKEELKERALLLEQELEAIATQSKDVALFAAYQPLRNVISRAKALEISEPEEIPGMQYWKFETSIFWDFRSLGEAFANFSVLLRGLEVNDE